MSELTRERNRERGRDRDSRREASREKGREREGSVGPFSGATQKKEEDETDVQSPFHLLEKKVGEARLFMLLTFFYLFIS